MPHLQGHCMPSGSLARRPAQFPDASTMACYCWEEWQLANGDASKQAYSRHQHRHATAQTVSLPDARQWHRVSLRSQLATWPVATGQFIFMAPRTSCCDSSDCPATALEDRCDGGEKGSITNVA